MKKLLYDFEGINKSLFFIINKYSNTSYIPHILESFSNLFFISNFAIIYILASIYLAIKIKLSKNHHKCFINIYYNMTRIGMYYAIFGLSFAALKFSINLPRPFCSLETDEFITIINTNKERCLSSFPSAHTGLSILICYIISPYISQKFKIMIWTIVPIVAISRISLAMHYPSDILYSALITSVIILFTNHIYKKLRNILIKPIGKLIFGLIFK